MPHFYSRREILKLIGGVPLAMTATNAAAADSRWQAVAKRRDSGPSLFFSASDLPAIRKRFLEDPRFSSLRDGLMSRDRAAERKFLREEIDYSDPLHDIRRAGERAQEMALIYLLTGDEDAADLAVECVRAIMQFPVWDFFLEGGEKVVGVQRASSTTIAVSCVVDWLGDFVSGDERQEWLNTMAIRGCEPCFTGLHNIRFPRESIGWTFNPATPIGAERNVFPTDMARRPEITQTTNLRAAPAGGLAIGVSAMALYGNKVSELERWLEMAVAHLKAFEQIYLPDGSHGEGVHYANYTSESILIGLEALRQSGVLDLELEINWSGHIDYMLNMAMPTTLNPYDVVNISDNGRNRHMLKDNHRQGRPEMRTALPYWVARKFRDGRAQWFGENLGALESMWSMVFRDESVKPVAPESGIRTWFPDLDWVVARTGFQADDLLVSLRSGIGFNHEHADRNSIIVKAFGEQLIVDPIRPPYVFNDPSWVLRLTAGHSAILIDGEGHLYNNGVEGTNSTIAQAKIVGKGSGHRFSYWISDATQAYRVANLETRNVVRAIVVFFDIPAVVVVDRVSKWKTASQIEARFFADNWDGEASVISNTNGFMIKRPGAFADAKVFCRESMSVEVGQLPIAEDRAAKHPFVGVKTNPTMATTIVSVVSLARAGEAPAEIGFKSDAEVIEATLKRGSTVAECRINDSASVPVIQAQA